VIARLASRLLHRADGPVTPRDLVHAEGSLQLFRYGCEPRTDGSCRPPVPHGDGSIDRHEAPSYGSRRPSVPHRDGDIDRHEPPAYGSRQPPLVDWGDPGALEARLGLGAHVARLERAVRKAAALAGSRDAALVGYCLGGTASLCLTALHPSLVRSLTLLATPVRFEAGGLLALWARASAVDARLFARTRAGNVPGFLLRELLRWQDPIGGITKWVKLLERAGDEDFRAAFVAQERWSNGCVDVPGRLFEDLIQSLYREDRLARGALDLDGRTAALKGLRTPILNVISDSDRIVPPASSLALAEIVGPEGRVTTLRAGGGHIGMTVGKRAVEATHRPIIQFLSRSPA
jgi:polyhydroxyalkanoate synthase